MISAHLHPQQGAYLAEKIKPNDKTNMQSLTGEKMA